MFRTFLSSILITIMFTGNAPLALALAEGGTGSVPKAVPYNQSSYYKQSTYYSQSGYIYVGGGTSVSGGGNSVGASGLPGGSSKTTSNSASSDKTKNSPSTSGSASSPSNPSTSKISKPSSGSGSTASKSTDRSGRTTNDTESSDSNQTSNSISSFGKSILPTDSKPSDTSSREPIVPDIYLNKSTNQIINEVAFASFYGFKPPTPEKTEPSAIPYKTAATGNTGQGGTSASKDPFENPSGPASWDSYVPSIIAFGSKIIGASGVSEAVETVEDARYTAANSTWNLAYTQQRQETKTSYTGLELLSIIRSQEEQAKKQVELYNENNKETGKEAIQKGGRVIIVEEATQETTSTQRRPLNPNERAVQTILVNAGVSLPDEAISAMAKGFAEDGDLQKALEEFQKGLAKATGPGLFQGNFSQEQLNQVMNATLRGEVVTVENAKANLQEELLKNLAEHGLSLSQIPGLVEQAREDMTETINGSQTIPTETDFRSLSLEDQAKAMGVSVKEAEEIQNISLSNRVSADLGGVETPSYSGDELFAILRSQEEKVAQQKKALEDAGIEVVQEGIRLYIEMEVPVSNTATEQEAIQQDEDYLWSLYSGAFRANDQKAADMVGMSLKEYVIGGMDDRFVVQLAAACRAAEADGATCSINAGYRGDERQAMIGGGTHADDCATWHGGSCTTGYGEGKAVDLNGLTTQKWMIENGPEFGIAHPYGCSSLGDSGSVNDCPHFAPADSGEVYNRAGRDGGMSPAAVDAIYKKILDARIATQGPGGGAGETATVKVDILTMSDQELADAMKVSVEEVKEMKKISISNNVSDSLGGSPTSGGGSAQSGINLVDFVKSKEGFSSEAYDDAGNNAIGYGTRANSTNEVITEAEATRRLEAELEKVGAIVDANVKVSLTGNQRDALISFVFNVGEGSFKDSTLLRRLNNGEYDAVSSEMARWVKSEGKILQGLVTRRLEEGRMFNGVGGVSVQASSARAPYNPTTGLHTVDIIVDTIACATTGKCSNGTPAGVVGGIIKRTGSAILDRMSGSTSRTSPSNDHPLADTNYSRDEYKEPINDKITSDITVVAQKAEETNGNEYRFKGLLRRTIESNNSNLSDDALKNKFQTSIENELFLDLNCDDTIDASKTFTTPYRSILPRSSGVDVLISEYLPVPSAGLHCFSFEVDINDDITESNENNNVSQWQTFITNFNGNNDDVPNDTSLPPFTLEVSSYRADGAVVTNWKTDTISIGTGEELAFRWDAQGYDSCIPFIYPVNYDFSGDVFTIKRDTDTEQIDVRELTKTYVVRCQLGNASRSEEVQVTRQ